MNLEAVRAATKEAGFDLKWTELEVVGSVTRRKLEGTEILSLTLRGRPQEILIVPGEEEDARVKFTEVARWAGEPGKTLQLQGRAHTHRGGEIAMTVKTFQLVEDRSK